MFVKEKAEARGSRTSARGGYGWGGCQSKDVSTIKAEVLKSRKGIPKRMNLGISIGL